MSTPPYHSNLQSVQISGRVCPPVYVLKYFGRDLRRYGRYHCHAMPPQHTRWVYWKSLLLSDGVHCTTICVPIYSGLVWPGCFIGAFDMRYYTRPHSAQMHWYSNYYNNHKSEREEFRSAIINNNVHIRDNRIALFNCFNLSCA